MPPAISDDETSEPGDVTVPIVPTKRERASAGAKRAESEEMPPVIRGDIENGGDEEEEEDDDEDLEPDEFIVEKILTHVITNGVIKYKVKWEGYEKKSDQTWEEESNLLENASSVLEEYLESIGGRDKILEDSQEAVSKKKRGRPAAGTPTNGSKRAKRNESHASSTPPASALKDWKPPAGSWENDVESIDACHDESTGKLVVYITWKNKQKTQHDTKIVYSRCPQKMLQFYEQHVKIVKSSSEAGQD